MKSNKYYSNMFIGLSVLACFLSNISQLPLFVTSGKTQLVCFPVWLILFVVAFLKCHGKVSKRTLPFGCLALLFIIGIMLNMIITGNGYFSSSLAYSFLISSFIFVIGALSSKWFDEDMFKKISIAYIASTFIVSLSVFFTYFGFGYSLNTRLYAYASKNSFAQIVFVAIVLLLCTYNPQNRIMKILKWCVLAFELLLVVFLRSRATILSLAVVVFIITISKQTNKKLKVLICSACIIVFFSLLANDDFNNLVVNNILFAGRDAASLDSLSSGRVSIIKSFPDLLKNHWLVGIGPTYFECFPLSAILQFGLIPGGLLIIIAVYPACVGWMKRHDPYFQFLFLIALGFVVDGLFEGLTPFGPGIKCYFVWYMFGMLICRDSDYGSLRAKKVR